MPDNTVLHTQLQQFFNSGDLGGALYVAQCILANDPDHADANLAVAKIRLRQGLWSEAETAGHRVLSARPGDETALVLISNIHGRRGQTHAALEWCDRALAENPGSLTALHARSQHMERSGDWKGALDTLDSVRVPVSSPDWSQLIARCQLQGNDPGSAVATIDQGLSMLDGTDPSTESLRVRLLLIRAKALDALHRYENAFADTLHAKKLKAIQFDPSAYVASIDRIIETFNSKRMQPVPDHAGAPVILPPASAYAGNRNEHVFIVGMPRSGTTLVEQILDAHPEVTGVGEAKEIDICARRLQRTLGSWAPWPACVDNLTPDIRRELANSYEQALVAHGYPAVGTFVNKNLNNPGLVGLIALLFPRARIIFTHRDPRDVGLSCFMGNFSSEVHPELQDLDHIALAIQQHDRLIAHWKSVLGLRWMDVQYEELVSDQDRVTREMVEFCGLPWDETCLKFFDSGRTVMTLSYDQVNKPMYTTSIGRYRNYESHISPLMKLVND